MKKKLKKNRIFWSLCTEDIRMIMFEKNLKISEDDIREIETKFELEWHDTMEDTIQDYVDRHGSE